MSAHLFLLMSDHISISNYVYVKDVSTRSHEPPHRLAILDLTPKAMSGIPINIAAYMYSENLRYISTTPDVK
jgi:hypothetical protein